MNDTWDEQHQGAGCHHCPRLQTPKLDLVAQTLQHIIGPSRRSARQDSVTISQNKSLIERYYYEMWNPWNFAAADQLLSETFSFRGSLGTETVSREAFRNYMRQVQSAFPDFHNHIESIVAEEQNVVARLTYRGTHHGEIFGIAPTKKSIQYAGVAFFRISRGQLAEGWVLGDLLTLLGQLGARELPHAI
jgi:steroid delta-isomerase-like uncharacterized protein